MIARITKDCKAVQAYSPSESKHENCNTVLKPAKASVVPTYPHEVEKVPRNDVSYFIDWLRFFGKDLKLGERHEELLVDLIIGGRLFIGSDQSDRELMEYEVRPAYGQIHQGSDVTWSYQYVNSVGVKLWISKDEELGKVVALKLDFSGQPLSHLLPRNNQLKLLEVIDIVLALDKNISVSRIDTTMEFSHELLNFDLVIENARNWNFSGVKKRHIHISDGVKKEEDAVTVLLGSEKSKTKKIRIYDTAVKHGYEALRIEVENKRKGAEYIVSELLAIYNEHCMDAIRPEVVNNKINSFICNYNLSIKTFNFVDKNSKKRWMKVENYTELGWWTKFKADIKHCDIKYKFKPEEKTVQKSIKWFVKNASSLLCAMEDNFGKSGLSHFIRHVLQVKRDGINCNAYSPNRNEYNMQLTDMGCDGLISAFCTETRWALRQVGYFDSPIPIGRKDKRCFVSHEDLRKRPHNYQSSLVF